MSKVEDNISRVEAVMNALRLSMVGARERLGAGLQLTRTQLEIIMMLADKPQTTGELARQLFLTGSAVTQTIDTLVRRELIARHPSEQDRRVIQLQLSPAGRQLADRIHSLRHKYLESLVDRLTDNEVEVLISVTKKVTQQLEATKTNPKTLNEEN